MADYSNVPAANALHAERELVAKAIAMIDAGGNLISIVIGPPPPEANFPGGNGMAATVNTPPPTPPDTLAAIRAQLVAREADIDAQLAELGVVSTPPSSAAARKPEPKPERTRK